MKGSDAGWGDGVGEGQFGSVSNLMSAQISLFSPSLLSLSERRDCVRAGGCAGKREVSPGCDEYLFWSG